jgi:hypothetical protein
MRTAGYLLGALLAASIGACARHNVQGAGAQSAQGPGAATACNIAQLHGVHATVADIKDGVAITFTGPAGSLDQLRDNVHAMADANDKQGDAFAACPCAQRVPLGSAEAMPSNEAPTGTTNPSKTGGAHLQSSAKVDEIATGAVLKLTAKEVADVSALRAAVRDDMHALKKNCLNKAPEKGPSTEPQGK